MTECCPVFVSALEKIDSLFVTRLYHAALSELGKTLNASELEATCLSIADDDEAGQKWCEENDFPGYTSYASLDDLPWRFPIFKDLIKVLDKHVAAFAEDLEFDLDEKDYKKPLFIKTLYGQAEELGKELMEFIFEEI